MAKDTQGTPIYQYDLMMWLMVPENADTTTAIETKKPLSDVSSSLYILRAKKPAK